MELWNDDGRFPLGRPQQRVVLAALAVDVGRAVPVDVLVDRVWGETPPQQARRTLHSHITRVRRVLEHLDAPAGEPASLVLRSGGYALEMDPNLVDLHRFRSLVAQARKASEAGPERVQLLRSALALWHGEPLVDMTGAWAERVRESWTLERVDAVVAWGRAELRAGNPQPVVVALTELVRDHSLVEPLAEVLIRALYAAGRSAEALDRYASVRRHLVDLLGTEPGVELRKLHQMILASAPNEEIGVPQVPEEAVTQAPTALDQLSASRLGRTGPQPVVPLPPRVVPAQLPMDVRGFAGREQELGRLDGLVATTDESNSVVVCALWGAAGVGKTALATHWAHRVASRFPDGQLYVNLRGFEPEGEPVNPSEAIRGFLDAFHVPPQRIPAGLDAQAALYRSLIAGRRVLVVLDNARDAKQVRPLLPGAPGSMVLITSRHKLDGLVAAEAVHALTVDLLSAEGARELLASRLGGNRLTSAADAVDRIIARCARLPLALTIVAARAATHPHLTLEALASQLDEACGGLDAFTGRDLVTDVRAVFSWTYHTLSPAASRLFRLLGVHPGPDLNPAAAAHLIGAGLRESRALLDELCRAHMLTEHRPGRFTHHDLLRAYAIELARTLELPGERRFAIQRVFDYYLHTAKVGARLLEPHGGWRHVDPSYTEVASEPLANARQALVWFRAEHAVLLAVIRRASEAGYDSELWKFARTLVEFLNRQGHWRDQAVVHEAALWAAQRLADPPAQAHAHHGLGLAHAWLGDYDEAHDHSTKALDLFGEFGTAVDQAQAHLGVARVFERQDRHAEALNHDQMALTLSQIAGDRSGQAVSLNNVGWSNAMLGNYEDALLYCERSLHLQQEINDPHGEAATWDSLGYIHHHLDHHDRAIECYRHAVDLYQEAGNRYGHAASLNHLGDTSLVQGDTDAARRSWQVAFTILCELDHPDAHDVRQKLADVAGLWDATSALGL